MNSNDDNLMWERLMQHREVATDQPEATPELVNEADAKPGERPDYPDVDGDGNTKESMKDALKDKEAKAEGDDSDSELDQKEDDTHNESVEYYIEQTLKDCQALGRERWFRTNWRRDRALLEGMATGDQAAEAPFENWSQEDFWRALVGVEREFYGL